VEHRYSALSTVGAIVASDSDSRATVRSEDFHQALLDADYDIEHTLIEGAPHSLGSAGLKQFDEIVTQTLAVATQHDGRTPQRPVIATSRDPLGNN